MLLIWKDTYQYSFLNWDKLYFILNFSSDSIQNLDSILHKYSTISFRKGRKLVKSTSNDFQSQNNKKRKRKREAKRKEEAKPCTFRSAQPKTRYRRKSRIRFEKQVEFSHLASSTSVRRSAPIRISSSEIFSKNRNVSIPEPEPNDNIIQEFLTDVILSRNVFIARPGFQILSPRYLTLIVELEFLS